MLARTPPETIPTKAALEPLPPDIVIKTPCKPEPAPVIVRVETWPLVILAVAVGSVVNGPLTGTQVTPADGFPFCSSIIVTNAGCVWLPTPP